MQLHVYVCTVCGRAALYGRRPVEPAYCHASTGGHHDQPIVFLETVELVPAGAVEGARSGAVQYAKALEDLSD